MMRAVRFQQQQWKWNLSNMVSKSQLNHHRLCIHKCNNSKNLNDNPIIPQSKKLKRKTEVMKQKKAQLVRQQALNMKMKQKHDEMYAELLKTWSRDELEHLLSQPLDDLKKMDLSPERVSPES